MPSSAKRNVQTGPNNQFGGLKKGLFSVVYQVGMAGVVAIAPSDPIISINNMKPSTFNGSIFSFISTN